MKWTAFCAFAFAGLAASYGGLVDNGVLARYVDKFNTDDEEIYTQLIPNSGALEFLRANIPIFECPDADIEAAYYFRWWTFRKHIKKTDGGGYVVTEFLPNVRWAGKYNAISCPAALHFGEGRWLKDPKYLESYARYWFDCGDDVRRYSFWPAHSILEFYKVNPDVELLRELYPAMKNNFAKWEKSNFSADTGLFWQSDDKDGMEKSISGSYSPKGIGYRATISSYMCGECSALSAIARLLGNESDSKYFADKAEALKKRINSDLWDDSARFYKVVLFSTDGSCGKRFSDVRELHGYTPWYFGIPPASYSDAWRQLSDEGGFKAPYGPTTAERRHPKFAVEYAGHECLWNGPSWPFATSITLVALANFINEYPHCAWADANLYFETLRTYAKSQGRTLPDGRRVMWIDEDLNPFTGDWISRTRLEKWENGTWSARKGGRERGKDYNHSQFCNLVISGLVGLRPQLDGRIAVNPLIPASWDWFALENARVKNRDISVFYDKTGKKYGRGKGLFVLVDGKISAYSDKIEKLEVSLK